MKILFAPSDLGGGLGHLSRCEALADYAKKMGYNYLFLLENPGIIEYVQGKHPFKKIQMPGSLAGEGINFVRSTIKHFLKQPIYIRISDLSYQVLRDGLVNEQIVQLKLDLYLQILRREKPDVVVGDTNLLIGVAARILGIPIVQIVRKAFYPPAPQLIWWDDPNPEIAAPQVGGMLNRVLSKYKIPPLTRAEDLLLGDMYIVASLPELEPIGSAENLHFIGPLLKAQDPGEEFIIRPPANQPVVYVTIGAGAGTVGSSTFFKMVLAAFQQKNYRVLVSTTPKFYTREWQKDYRNIQFQAWFPGRQIINMADLVIFHGGYGTMMETIDAGVPSIIVPFHTEQESNGRRLKQLHCAELLELSKQKQRIVERKWQNSTYSYGCNMESNFTADELYNLTHKVLSDSVYLEAVRLLQEKSRQFQAPVLFFQCIRDYIGVK